MRPFLSIEKNRFKSPKLIIPGKQLVIHLRLAIVNGSGTVHMEMPDQKLQQNLNYFQERRNVPYISLQHSRGLWTRDRFNGHQSILLNTGVFGQ